MGRASVLLQAARPAAAGLPLGTVGGAIALVALPTAVNLARGGDRFGGAVIAAALLGAGVLAFAVEDAAEGLLASMPVPVVWRRALRLVLLVAAVAVVWVVVAVLARAQDPAALDRLDLRAGEVAAAGGLAVAAAGLADRWAFPSSSATGALAGPLGVLVVSALAFRFDGLPSVAGPDWHERWWVLAVMGWAIAGWASRDPMRR